MTQQDGFRIRAMSADDMALAADWAAAEGWNPGDADAQCFATVDPQGFLIGELDGAAAATISCVNYDDRFSFLGFYIVRPDLRGRGYGLRIWNAAIAHAGARTVGLDGVVAQQENYKKSGFVLAYPQYPLWRQGRGDGCAAGGRRCADGCCVRGSSRRTTPRCFRRRAPHSCAPGSERAGMSAARSCATAGSPPGA